jgi:hypothetical protein
MALLLVLSLVALCTRVSADANSTSICGTGTVFNVALGQCVIASGPSQSTGSLSIATSNGTITVYSPDVLFRTIESAESRSTTYATVQTMVSQINDVVARTQSMASYSEKLSQHISDLQGNLSTEISLRVQLQLALGIEASARIAQGEFFSASQTLLNSTFSSVIAQKLSPLVSAEASIASLMLLQSASNAADHSALLQTDQSLRADLSAETSRALLGESSLSLSISAERARAILVENILNGSSLGTSAAAVAVQQEALRAIDRENALSNAIADASYKINVTEFSIAAFTQAEMNRAMSVELSLSAATTSERSRALAAETNLNATVILTQASLASLIVLETSRAVAIEQSLAMQGAVERARAMDVFVWFWILIFFCNNG